MTCSAGPPAGVSQALRAAACRSRLTALPAGSLPARASLPCSALVPQAFWVPSQAPASKDLLAKPDSATLCPASGKKLRLKDCVAAKFTRVPEGEGGRYMDPVTKDTFTNATKLVVIRPTGAAAGVPGACMLACVRACVLSARQSLQ